MRSERRGTHVTKAQAREYAGRWKLMNEREISELASTPAEVVLQQLDSLRSAIDPLGWREDLEDGIEEVRDRWNRLRILLLA